MFILYIRIDVISTASSSLFSTVTSNHYATPPPGVAARPREVIRHAAGRGWEKMENVEFRIAFGDSRGGACKWLEATVLFSCSHVCVY